MNTVSIACNAYANFDFMALTNEFDQLLYLYIGVLIMFVYLTLQYYVDGDGENIQVSVSLLLITGVYAILTFIQS